MRWKLRSIRMEIRPTREAEAKMQTENDTEYRM